MSENVKKKNAYLSFLVKEGCQQVSHQHLDLDKTTNQAESLKVKKAPLLWSSIKPWLGVLGSEGLEIKIISSSVSL